MNLCSPTSVICLFNEHVADQTVLQEIWRRKPKQNTKKRNFLLFYCLHHFLKCQLNTNCHFHINFLLIGEQKILHNGAPWEQGPHSPSVSPLSPISSSFPFS